MNLNFKSQPAMIESGVVVDVHPERFQVDVVTSLHQKIFRNVAYAVPYLNPGSGQGISFAPERGSLCWIMTRDSDPLSHDNDFKASVIAWQPPRDKEGGHTSGRDTMNPGDICVATKGGNKVLLRANGLVEIGSTALSKTVYIPTSNGIHHLCNNYQIDATGGFMRWQAHENEELEDPSSWILGVRKLAGDKNAYVTLTAGKDVGGLSITVMKDGTDESLEMDGEKPAGLMVGWDLTQEGNAILFCRETLSVEAKEISFSSQSYISMTAEETTALYQKILNVESSQRIKLEAPEIELVCDSLKVVTPEGIPLMTLTPGQPALLNETILSHILTHQHPPGGGPPIGAVNVVAAKAKSTGIS